MHKSKFVACIKVAGKVLRERNETVKLPFGSEYSIFLKNLNSVRALVKIEIDGQDVLGGNDLVVQPNSTVDLERYLNNGNLNEGNRFKFIERTSKIEDHRGVGAEDGLVRITFQFEKPATTWNTDEWWERYKSYKDYKDGYDQGRRDAEPYHPDFYPYWPKVWYGSPGIGSGTYSSTATNQLLSNDNILRSSYGSENAVYTANAISGVTGIAQSCATPTMDWQEVPNDAGITVPGSKSDQQFNMTNTFPVETHKEVIVLKLVGETEKGAVVEPVTVKRKQTCPTCGTRNRGSNKCCRECGTALELY